MRDTALEELKEDLTNVFNLASIGSFTVERRGTAFQVKIDAGKYMPKSVLEHIESLGYSFMTFQAMFEQEKFYLGITIGGKKNWN